MSRLFGTVRVQELCESGGGRPGFRVPNRFYGLWGRKAALKLQSSEGGESRSGRPVPNNNGRKAALKLQSSEGGESRIGRPVPNNNGRKAKLNLNRALSHRVVL